MDTKNEITYVVDNSEDAWGDLGEIELDDWVDLVAEKIIGYMKIEYPEIKFGIRFAPETMSFNNQPKCFGDEEFEYETGAKIINEIDEWVGRNWYDW